MVEVNNSFTPKETGIIVILDKNGQPVRIEVIDEKSIKLEESEFSYEKLTELEKTFIGFDTKFKKYNQETEISRTISVDDEIKSEPASLPKLGLLNKDNKINPQIVMIGGFVIGSLIIITSLYGCKARLQRQSYNNGERNNPNYLEEVINDQKRLSNPSDPKQREEIIKDIQSQINGKVEGIYLSEMHLDVLICEANRVYNPHFEFQNFSQFKELLIDPLYKYIDASMGALNNINDYQLYNLTGQKPILLEANRWYGPEKEPDRLFVLEFENKANAILEALYKGESSDEIERLFQDYIILIDKTFMQRTFFDTKAGPVYYDFTNTLPKLKVSYLSHLITSAYLFNLHRDKYENGQCPVITYELFNNSTGETDIIYVNTSELYEEVLKISDFERLLQYERCYTR